MQPTYGWFDLDKPCYKFTKMTRKRRLTLISAIRGDKIIANQIINGSANGEIFLDFIKSNILDKYNNQAILLDNARIHHTKILKENVRNTTNKLVYNVPYNPETNPIELVFGPLKAHIKTTKKNNTIKEVTNIIKSHFKSITRSTLKKYYRKSLNK